MSLVDDVDMYKRIMAEGIVRKASSVDENSTEYVILPKCEHIEETLVVGEEIVVDENMDINQQVADDPISVMKETAEYLHENISSNAHADLDYVESCSTEALSINVVKDEWSRSTSNKDLMLLNSEVKSEMDSNRSTDDEHDGDEETIATFVTAAGQQLALYAVEDSEEIFAVAVYDESGEPPTNFQFLMKTDVERLIGEGAVRTVKKPTQIKKQLLTTQPPLFFAKDESMEHVSTSEEDKTMLNGNQDLGQKNNVWCGNPNLIENSNADLNMKPVPNIIYTTGDKQTDVTYVMMNDCSVTHVDQVESNVKDEVESDGEFVEQSTVQYILFEGDQSDSELTFDEIQVTLRNMKDHRSSTRKAPCKKSNKDPNQYAESDVEGFDCSMHRNSSFDGADYASNSLMDRKSNLLDERQELIDALSSPTSGTIPEVSTLNLLNGSLECASPKSAQTRLKAKRSRKQQLTSMNREDTEIIIQPASLLSEEDSSIRKRGKRRRRVVPHAGYHQRNNGEPKRLKRNKHKEVVEVIEIDVDEEETAHQRNREVVEITIDDSKDKYSSDKENEIIMVGDSDEEPQQNDPKAILLQCQHCSRSFRQQRALDTHMRVCSKSPANAVRLMDRKAKYGSRVRGEEKKQYACKVCQEKFDVVVALARHVRSEHSQRRKRMRSKEETEQEPDPMLTASVKRPQISMIRRVQRKRTRRPKCSWEVKKLSCTDCGRWFPSAALLNAHCLQHGTKKTEKQRRRCHVCRKLIKSRLLFIQHLKLHSKVQQTTKSATNVLQKKLRTTRSVTRKSTALRKRGRPRKL